MRNAIIAGVLLVIIVVAVVFAVRKSGGGSKAPTADAAKQTFTVINVDTLQPATVTLGDWESWKDEAATGYKLNPKGDKFTNRTMTCQTCRELIPAEPRSKPGQDEDEARRQHICPKCKKPAFAEMGP